MANFSSLPDPWDEPASPPQQPDSAPTGTDTIPPAPDLDTDLFRDVLVDLDSLLQSPTAPSPTSTTPAPPPPTTTANPTATVASEPTPVVEHPVPQPDLTDRISKFEPLELDEPVDETLPLLDMPLADLQATFGIGSQPQHSPDTQAPEAARISQTNPPTAPHPPAPEPTPPVTSSSGTELPTLPPPTPPSTSSPTPPQSPRSEPQHPAIRASQPDPEQPDALRDAAIAYRDAEVNETVNILNELFKIERSSADTQTATKATLVPPEASGQSTAAVETSHPVKAATPTPSNTTQIPFPQDDIFPTLGHQTTAPASESRGEINAATKPDQQWVAPLTTGSSDTPVATETTTPQTEHSELPSHTPPSPTPKTTTAESVSEPETAIAPPPSEPDAHSTPDLVNGQRQTQRRAPDLEQQLSQTLLNLVNETPDTPEPTEPERSTPPETTASSEVVPLSPLEQRRIQLEAQLERELQAFWDAASNQTTEPNPKPQAPPQTKTEPNTPAPPAVTVVPTAQNGHSHRPKPPTNPTPSRPRTPSEQLDAAVESTFGILNRDFSSLFSSSSTSAKVPESEDDPLQDIRQYLLGKQTPDKQTQGNPALDTQKPVTPTSESPPTLSDDFGELQDLSESVDDPPSARLITQSTERPRYAPVEIEPFKRFDAIEAKLAQLEKQVYEPTDVLNPLLPLIAQLLKMRLGTTQDTVREMATPILDEMIMARSTQNREAMTQAFASLIPDAITQEVQNNPERIARAIGPEVGAAIREQIRIERDAISESLGPTIGKAIKTQIEVERDSMVDALYPVIGSTVSRYMGEVLNTINEKVESTLSVDGVSRKIRARVQGVSEAELILQESMPATIQAMFLIHKTSGLVIAEVQPNLDQHLESNMIAGMLTAIRSFVNDCIAQTGEITELNEIEYGDSRIMLEVAGYCYLAIVAKGKLPKPMINRLRRVFGQITQRHGSYIEDFEGEMDTVPPEITAHLKQVGDEQNEQAQQQTKAKRSPTTLLILLGVLAALVTVPWLYFQVRGWFDGRLSRQVAVALAQELDPMAYADLVPTVNGKQLQLEGRVPSVAIQERAAAIAQEIAPQKTLTNNIQVVQAPLDPNAIATSMQVVTSILNREPGIDIQTEYTPEQIIVRGTYNSPEAKQTIEQALGTLPGIPPLNHQKLTPQIIQERIYFETESAVITTAEHNSKVLPLAALLQAQPNVRIRLIGHTDPRGTEKNNSKLAQARANAVRNQLQAAGIAANRLEIMGEGKPPPGIGRAQPFWLNRCVRFEIIKR